MNQEEQFKSLLAQSYAKFDKQNEPYNIQIFDSLLNNLNLASLSVNISNEERNKASKILSENKLEFISNCDVVLDRLVKSDLDDRTKLSVIVFFKNGYKDLIKEKKIDEKQMVITLNSLINLIIKGNLDEKLIINITHIITEILNSEKLSLNKEIGKNLLEMVFEIVNSLNQDSILKANIYLSIFISIYCSKTVNRKNLKNCYFTSLQMFEFLFEKILKELENHSILNEIKLLWEFMHNNPSTENYFNAIKIKLDFKYDVLSINYRDLNEYNEISSINMIDIFSEKFISFYRTFDSIHSTLNFLYKFLNETRKKKFNKKDMSCLEYYSANFYYKLFDQISYFIFVDFQTLSPNVEATYYFSGVKNIDYFFNCITGRAHQILNLMSNNTNSEAFAKIEKKGIKVKESLKQIFIKTVKSLIFTTDKHYKYLSEENYECYRTEKPDCSYSYLTYYRFMSLARLIGKEFISKEFKSEYKPILLNLVIPYLKDVKYLKYFIEDSHEINADQYFNHMDDLVSKQETKTIQCVCAYLIQEICDVYEEDAVRLIVNISMSCILNCLEIPNNFNQRINEDIGNSSFYKIFTKEELLEVGFSILSIINESIKIHENVANEFQVYINSIFPKILLINNSYILSKFITFAKLFALSFFYNDNLFNTVDFMFNLIFTCGQSKILENHVIKSLCELYSSSKSIQNNEYLKKSTEKHLQTLLDYYDKIDNDEIFDVLLEIINNFNLSKEKITSIIINISEKILSSVGGITRIGFKKKSPQNKTQEKINQRLFKFFNILRSICENSHYVVNAYVIFLYRMKLKDVFYQFLKNYQMYQN